MGAAAICSLRASKRGAEASAELAAFDTDGDGLVSSEERKVALEGWKYSYKQTADLWHSKFSSSYRLTTPQLQQQAPAVVGGPLHALISAAKRQASFNHRILRLGPRVITPQWIQTAVRRYMLFLQLAKEQPGVLLVPTLDVDLIWHAHMLSPEDYRDDCRAFLGRLLQHNDDVSEGRLEESFEQTKQLWQARFGENYTMARQRADRKSASGSGGSACASCAWGDAHYHRHLEHEVVEPQIVADAGGPADSADSYTESDIGWGDASENLSWSSCSSAISSSSSGDASSCGGGCGGD